MYYPVAVKIKLSSALYREEVIIPRLSVFVGYKYLQHEAKSRRASQNKLSRVIHFKGHAAEETNNV